MRFGTRFRCPQCLAESRSDALCEACRVPVEQLETIPRPSLEAKRWLDWPWILRGCAAAVGSIWFFSSVYLVAIGMIAYDDLRNFAMAMVGGMTVAIIVALYLARLGDRNPPGPLIRAASRAYPTPAAARPIASLHPGDVATVSGTVRVLAPVADSTGVTCAAWASRVYGDGDPFHGGGCGRFAIEDGSGAVLVDDDCFVLSDHRTFARGPVVVRSGDRVDAMGRVAQAPRDAAALIGPGLRSAGESLSLEGTVEAPIVITVVGRGTGSSG